MRHLLTIAIIIGFMFAPQSANADCKGQLARCMRAPSSKSKARKTRKLRRRIRRKRNRRRFAQGPYLSSEHNRLFWERKKKGGEMVLLASGGVIQGLGLVHSLLYGISQATGEQDSLFSTTNGILALTFSLLGAPTMGFAAMRNRVFLQRLGLDAGNPALMVSGWTLCGLSLLSGSIMMLGRSFADYGALGAVAFATLSSILFGIDTFLTSQRIAHFRNKLAKEARLHRQKQKKIAVMPTLSPTRGGLQLGVLVAW